MEDLIKALQILVKYGNPKKPFYCDHGYLFINISYEKVSTEDIAELEKLGFYKSNSVDRFWKSINW